VLHANKPVRTIEDMKDLRLHVQTRFAGDAVRALGAVAVPMPSAQLPLAITQHVIDGGIDPWNMMPALKLNDLLKTHTEFADVSPSSMTFALVMNKAAYDRLPKDLKTVIDANSGLPAAGMAGTMWDLQAAAASDVVAQRGDPITTLQPEAVAHWRKAVQPVTDAWLKGMKEQKVDGAKLLASAHASLLKYVDEPEPQSAQTPQADRTSDSSQPSQTARQPQQKLPSEAKVEGSTPAKSDAASTAPAKPAASAPAANPEVSVSAAPQAPAPDKPQSWSSWLRSWFSSKSTASSAPAASSAAHAPSSSVAAPSAPVASSPPPAASPAPTASAPVVPAPAATASVGAPPPVPAPAAPVVSPPAAPIPPAPTVTAPIVNPAPIPAPVTPFVKPAAKAIDIPL
jgi:hypothetical protein